MDTICYKKNIVVIVPSLIDTAPVKGAIALCNGLSERYRVFLIHLKKQYGVKENISKHVKVISLGERKNYLTKILALKRFYKSLGGLKNVVSISFCFSSDFINMFLKKNSRIISSVRCDFSACYKFDFGFRGKLIAFIHYNILKQYDDVVAMSYEMKQKLKTFGLNNVYVIGNFLNETYIDSRIELNKEEKKENKVKFLYLGRLDKIKKIELIIESVKKLIFNGSECILDIVGNGPLMDELKAQVDFFELQNHINFHGYMLAPFKIIMNADYTILPSVSEGLPRSILESLYLGTPCILRDIDGNSGLIKDGFNGYLFKNDEDFYFIIKKAIKNRLNKDNTKKYILNRYRQGFCVKQYCKLVDSL